ncbi:MAG: hypothetical protein BWK73_41305 [Thiothrix lacustris]|uniref:DUF11 domain-containing protein n=1 Tax=Thiothrix lacustris TaxID=525917 RepID=A0A1Y1QD98_9GAMM|nr:MAG: hypothetical protein BWK73_41305 [Thiothrix lacustris]
MESWLKPSASTAGGGTSVQFAKDGTIANFAVSDPNDYWDTTQSPRYVIPQYWNGIASANTIEPGVTSTLYPSTGLNSNYTEDDGVTQGTGPVPRTDLTVSEIGSVWGTAYHKIQKHFYFTTFLKRNVGMADGVGYIYNADYSGATPSLTGKFDLQGVIPTNGGSAIDLGTVTRTGSDDFTLALTKTDPSWDLDAFGKVGTMSYGDADIQPNTDYLWTVNLFQKALIRVDVSGNPSSTPSNINQYILSSLPGYPTSSTGILRPWGLKFAYGKGYLGIIDDASISLQQSDLKAIVLEFDPNNITAGFTQKLNFDPNIKRYIADNPIEFYPWIDTYAEPPVEVRRRNKIMTQPILSDMEFDEHGNMYLSFFDRWGHQMGYYNYLPISGDTTRAMPRVFGENLKACKASTGWEIEGAGSCHIGTDEFIQDISGDSESESSQGAIALLKGKNQLLQVSIDPHPQLDIALLGAAYWNTQGTITYDLNNGQINNWYSFYRNSDTELYGKANGLGDVELITPPAPIEIGNRVWLDADNDGIQDAGENGIPNVQVQLLSGATVVATATTAADGTYYFTNATGTNTASKIYGLTQLQPNTAYTVKFPTTMTVSGTTYNLTTATAGGNTQIDSNAPATGEVTVAAADIPSAGANNHSFDVGYSTTPTCSINAPTVTAECNNNGTPSDVSDDKFTYKITATGSNVGATYSITGGDTYANRSYGTEHTSTNSFPISGGNLALTLTDDTTASCKLDNVAVTVPATCSSSILCAKPFDPFVAAANQYLEVNTATPILASTVDDASILGGERDMKMEKLQASDPYSGTFYVGDDGAGNGIIDITNGPGDFSKGTVVWDGNDNDANTLNPNGLGGVDLSSGDAFKMLVTGVDIERFKITLRVYSGAANVSESVFAYDNTQPGTSSNIPVTFSLAPVAGSGADLTKVGAVELIFEPIDLDSTANGIDLTLGSFTAPCPQTASTTHSIGNRVWIDTNNNGLADVGESAVPANVKLDLKNAGGTVSSTQTDANGRYLFHGLAQGSYKVCLSADNFTGGGVLVGYTASTGKTPTPNAETDPTDGDDNGSDDTAVGICSELVTLGTDEPTGETSATGNDGNDGQGTPDTNSNLTVDFGVIPPVLCNINAPTVTSACNNNGTPSNASDDKFTYKITATGSNVGATYSITGGDTYANRSYGTEHTSTNSFPISGGNLALTLTDDTTASCTLSNITVTAPATCSSSQPVADLSLKKTVDKNVVQKGDTLVYTITVTNAGPDAATGVEVKDKLPTALSYVSDDGQAVYGSDVYDDVTGIWQVGSLAKDESKSLKITAKVN